MSGLLRGIPLTSDKAHAWDCFVENSGCATMFHLTGWKTVFETVFGFRPYYLMCEDDVGEVSGVLPMFMMKDFFHRKYLISNPFSSYAGICSEHPETVAALWNQCRLIATRTAARYVEFRQLNRGLPWRLPARESFVTLLLNLPADPDRLWNGIGSRNRNKIRKAEKSGLSVDSGMHYLKDFYNIFAMNLKHLGTPVFPYSMFESVAAVFKDRCELLVLKLENRPVSGMFLFKFKDIIAEPWVASLRRYHHLYINNYLYWQAIRYACKKGFSRFDMGRSTIDSGTYRFKRQWGAEPIALRYQYYLNTAAGIPVVDAHHNRYRHFIAVWKRLPLMVTNFIGPRVVKYLPEY